MPQEKVIMTRKLAMPLLAAFMWVVYIHAGTFASAVLLPAPETGYAKIARHLSSIHFGDVLAESTKITGIELNRSIAFGRSILNRMQRLENNLVSSDIFVKKGTPSQGQAIASSPEKEAVLQGRSALIATKATLHLLNQFCTRHDLGPSDCVKFISSFGLSSTPLNNICDGVYKKCSTEEMQSPYRSVDGSCNHRSFERSGESFTGYRRHILADYADGIQEPRRSVIKKHILPSPRLISTSLVKNFEHLSDDLTLAVMQWGQLVEHDLSQITSSKMIHVEKHIECCSGDGSSLPPRYIHPFCTPISVPLEDQFYSRHSVDCMSYVRSVPALRADCTFGPTEQLNQATHLLDGSSVYGSTVTRSNRLRSFVNGRLDVSYKDHRQFLPTSTKPTHDCQVATDKSKCFVAGDSRVNELPQLAVMHTLWLREHNRIADELTNINPHWDEETIFQEARKIVIAEIQHITYNEYIPVILGKKYAMKVLKDSEFREEVDPSVSNSFATAAFRFIYSLLTNKIGLYTENRSLNASLSLRNYYNNPGIIEEPSYLDSFIRGLATQPSQEPSINYAEEVTNYLFSNGHYGFDILSLDIQRGRDHGLPSYTRYRTLCGFPETNRFDDFLNVMTPEVINKLKEVYASPFDVDLIVGGLLEKPDGDSQLGPTFSCLIADQFLRTRRGDRYFYTNNEQPTPFSLAQIKEIEKIKLARIFCDNSDDVKRMQGEVFLSVTDKNTLLDCQSNEIPHLNLRLWTDNYTYY